MSEADQFLADLNSELDSDGEDIILRRITGTGSNPVFFDVEVRAFVRAFAPNELVGTLSQTDSKVILSPSQIEAAGWPGPGVISSPPPAHAADPVLPKTGDKAIIQGRIRNITFVKPTVMNGKLIRIELTVAG